MNYAGLAATLGIQGYIQSKEYRARCPLHNDTNPSFSLNLEDGRWICFKGCGQGKFTGLVQLILNCSTQEAYDWVNSNGRKLGTEQVMKQLNIELANSAGHPDYRPPDIGWHSYYQTLVDNIMPAWFLHRGFDWHTVWHWKIKYDPIMDSVSIPVYWQKELVGLVTRNTRPGYPKYQNSPNLPRSDIFFGEILSYEKYIILVEGVLDALWLWQLGYNVVSLLGTYLSNNQLKILQAHKLGEIVLALDNDEAGIKGTKEATERLLKAGWLHPQITKVRFPEDFKDPQDCLADEWAQLFEQRKDVLNEQLV